LQLTAVATLLECEVMCARGALESDVSSCFAADLMSDVLAFAQPHALLITGLTTVQSVHTADIADCKGILYVCSKRPAPEAIELARHRDLPLLSTRHTTHDACRILVERGLAAAANHHREAPCGGR
jgi:predicted transcriptional regulator